MKKSCIIIFALILTCILSTNSFAQGNKMAYFMIDADLAQEGFQGASSVTGIGPNQLVGFAIYAKNIDVINGLKVTFDWDGTKATQSDKSGLDIGSGASNINGADITVAAESSIITSAGGTLIPLGEEKEAGHYLNNYATLGATASSADFGLLYYLVLQTSASFTTGDTFSVKAEISVANAGVEKYLGYRYFNVNATGTDVQTKTWGEIKNQFKDF